MKGLISLQLWGKFLILLFVASMATFTGCKTSETKDNGNDVVTNGDNTGTDVGATDEEADKEYHEHIARAEALLSDGRFEEAREEYTQANNIKGDPDGVIERVLRQLALKLQKPGKFKPKFIITTVWKQKIPRKKYG